MEISEILTYGLLAMTGLFVFKIVKKTLAIVSSLIFLAILLIRMGMII